ncbi:MAG: hypothetical protein QGG33_04385 [Candidatus Krumholzibacteria bacterium]|nr:hypothetical protein [Candidatus Krumholzibacteria bacterium]
MKVLVFSLLAGIFLSLPALADPGSSYTIVLEAGATEFSMGGEDFLCVTGQSTRIVFDGISSERVYGRIILLEPGDGQPVKLIWVSAYHHPMTLHNRAVSTKIVFFDSDVTGHNEKEF